MFDKPLAGKRNEVLSLFLAEAAAMLAPIRPPAIKKVCQSSVFLICDNLRRIRILGSVHWITDPALSSVAFK
jgi:hypothetical protein